MQYKLSNNFYRLPQSLAARALQQYGLLKKEYGTQTAFVSGGLKVSGFAHITTNNMAFKTHAGLKKI